MYFLVWQAKNDALEESSAVADRANLQNSIPNPEIYFAKLFLCLHFHNSGLWKRCAYNIHWRFTDRTLCQFANILWNTSAFTLIWNFISMCKSWNISKNRLKAMCIMWQSHLGTANNQLKSSLRKSSQPERGVFCPATNITTYPAYEKIDSKV